MQSLPPDLYAYTLKNPQRLDRALNTVADVYNIPPMSLLWHSSVSAI